ncbi:Moesin/ezrin/radixin 1 [Araneus ventricosus]|uniref:Moesin/ezrin/radixin 1 n=1 Tax=Araneus ventricosus TaxID=182803 RepID=A0A4Y2XCB7_ARAVE|nr:Moesin/ezrin/radixin 1 [Araneus ventricosus]GBO37375.1 Moesin/ezrin/radixin 1 [Araneus ventricosus]GBO46886.1 Moesin/ezrin/radixin 1 [Araneus ventricosus]GBO46889.1 Moesin/ezrin/radixin 1 [Araneus ventricosus]
MEAQDSIRRLEEQLRQVQKSKAELEEKQNELEEMLKKLENDKAMEAEEKARLAEAIMVKQKEVQRIQEEVNQKDEETRKLQEEVEEARRRQEEAAAALLEATTPQHLNIQEDESEENDDMVNGEYGAELSCDDSINLPKPEEDRSTQVSKEKHLQDQLKELSKELASSKDETKLTKNDLLHQENVRQGRDKYKTLREIRKGNTKRRVDQFENM